MRIQNCGNGAKLVEFADWLQKLGNVTLQPIEGADSYLTMPEFLNY